MLFIGLGLGTADGVDEIEIKFNLKAGVRSIGIIRIELLQMATGKYIVFVDDDDMVSDKYVQYILGAIADNPTHCSLLGVYTEDGGKAKLFHHSNKYKEYKTNNTGAIVFERYPNHLNVIKSAIAKRYSFTPINHGEDTEWATQLLNGGELTDEAEIKEVLYHYKFITNK